VLSQSALTLTTGPVTIINGYYGCADSNYLGVTPSTSGTPSGVNQGLIPQANSELNDLITAINDLSLNQVPYSLAPVKTILSGQIYTAASITEPSGLLRTITFDASGNPNAQFYIVSNSFITLNNITMNLINGANPYNIFWLAKGSGTGAITITQGSAGLNLYGNFISIDGFTLTNNTPGTVDISGNIYAEDPTNGAITITNAVTIRGSGTVICYLKGTKILTENGYQCIEDLRVGDKIVSQGKIVDNQSVDLETSVQPINWIGKFNIQNVTSRSSPICFQAHSLGENLPSEDLYVSPGHRIIQDGLLVLARDLVNGKTIIQDYQCDSVEYYHFELEEHSIVVANGALTESYLPVEGYTRDIFESIE
jgi:hypothetical protein